MKGFGSLFLSVPSAAEVRSGLLQYNYFPAITKHGDELPPCVNTKSLTSSAATALIAASTNLKRSEFDAVHYESTRYNLVSRRLSMPHPLPYVRLVESIAQNWSNLDFVAKNSKSQFRPASHGDGRIVAMNYGAQWQYNRLAMRWRKFGAEYRVKADIANFYPSFYTHSIPWALMSHAFAKKNRSKKLWFNELDAHFSYCNRGETNGLHVGPGTSALAADIVLTKVDDEMGKKYDYIRFIDDYEFYAKDRKEAEDFILDLSREVARYSLRLSGTKTAITDMPTPEKPHWMRALIPQIPQSGQFSRLAGYLDEAVELAQNTPDGSVLRFAVNAVFATKDIEIRADEILPHLFTIAFHNPGLLPAISKIFDNGYSNAQLYSDRLNATLERHARFRRSDGMSWVLHILIQADIEIQTSAIAAVVDTRDCIALTLLHRSAQKEAVTAAKNFVDGILTNAHDDYDLDQYWILLFEMFRDGVIADPYGANDTTFSTLSASGVSFVS